MKASSVGGQIETERLRLVPIPPEGVRLLIAGRSAEASSLLGATLPDGFPDAGEIEFLAIQLARMDRAPDRRQWMVRLMVLAATSEAVGYIAFHGPPEMIGRAEIGYTVFPERRRQGYAAEAVQGMIGWAARQGADAVYLSISPANGPSLAIARRLGFLQVGVQEDEVDGTELVFQLDLHGGAGAR